MTPTNLFNIILKVFGLFFLREMVLLIPQVILFIPYFSSADHFGSQNNNENLSAFIATLFIILFYSFIIYQLLFRTNKIVNKLRLNRGFNQEEFSFNISASLCLTIALIVTGGIILINEIPVLCRSLFSYIQEKKLHMVMPNYSYIITSAVKIIIGLLIIGERKRIIEFIEKRQSKNEEIK